MFTDDFSDDYFYLSEAIEKIVRVDGIRTRERHELFRLLSDRRCPRSVARFSGANKVIHDIKTV